MPLRRFPEIATILYYSFLLSSR